MVSGILTVRQTVWGALQVGALASSSTGAPITIVEPKFGPESTTAASGVPQPAVTSPATTTIDQRTVDFIGYSPFRDSLLVCSSVDQKPYCSPNSNVARL